MSRRAVGILARVLGGGAVARGSRIAPHAGVRHRVGVALGNSGVHVRLCVMRGGEGDSEVDGEREISLMSQVGVGGRGLNKLTLVRTYTCTHGNGSICLIPGIADSRFTYLYLAKSYGMCTGEKEHSREYTGEHTRLRSACACHATCTCMPSHQKQIQAAHRDFFFSCVALNHYSAWPSSKTKL